MGRHWTYRPPSFSAWVQKLKRRRRPVGGRPPVVTPLEPLIVGIRRLSDDELFSFNLNQLETVSAGLSSGASVGITNFSYGPAVSIRRLVSGLSTSVKLRATDG